MTPPDRSEGLGHDRPFGIAQAPGGPVSASFAAGDRTELRGSRPAGRTGLSTIPEAIAAIGRGEAVIVVDDHDRENEGDFVVAAEHATPVVVNFLTARGRGLLCAPMTADRLDALRLPPMVADNGDPHGTAFTVSVDLRDPDSTGISAAARAATIRALIDPHTRARDLRRPGHVFPLRARSGGVLRRAGHTEAAVDLARLAGCRPAGVICEIMSPDGSMARLPELLELADRHALHLVTVADLVAHRQRTERLLDRSTEARLPTRHGEVSAVGFRSRVDGGEHLALVAGEPTDSAAPLVRVHSECLTGDALGSERCDCGAQLDAALAAITAAEAGVLIYARGHEGRGIGLMDKIAAYGLQDDGADTVEANVELGYPPDARDYGVVAQILRELEVPRIRLLTNNPAKQAGLEEAGIEVAERVPLPSSPTAGNRRYLAAKRDKLGHLLDLESG